MAANANIKAVITADDRASSVLKKFGDDADKAGRAIGKTFAAVGVATVAAGAAAVAFGVSAVKSYEESENALAQLNATLTSTGGVAGVTADAAVDLANSLQKVTKFSDEEVLAAENLLLTFTKIGKDIFPEATKTVLDMSTALGQDTKSSAIQLGKALQDPILGVTALRRVGVNFNEAQQDVIRNLVETGRSAEAQRLILEELRIEFGGSAEAAGKTFAGKLAILKNQFDEVKESIGLAIVNGITPFMTKVSEFISSDQFQAWLERLTQWLSVNLPIALDYVTNTLIPNLKSILEQVWPVISIIIEWLGKFIQFLADHTPELWAFIGVLGIMKAAFFINDAVLSFQASMLAIRSAYAVTTGVLSVPIMITIAVAAALAALELIRRKAVETWNEIDRTERAFANMKSAQQDARARLVQLTQTGTPEQRRVAAEQLRKGDAAGTFGNAAGTNFFSGGSTLVGEQGPEVVNLPRGSKITPNNSVRTGQGNTINVIVQAGAYMGNQQDARRYARLIVDSIKDIAKMEGSTAAEVLA